MLKILPIIFLLLLYSCAAYGWGRAAEGIVKVHWPWPMSACLGLATIVAIGGVLVSLELAYAVTLDLIVAIGLLLAAAAIWKKLRSRPPPHDARAWRTALTHALPGLLVILGATIFTATYLVPPQVFNPYDDFETYLSLPSRLLATGTLKPGQFNNFGINSLGGQPFLHAFVAAHRPIEYINAVDALFGTALCATSVLVTGMRTGVTGWLLALAAAIVYVISPQYVNVSTLYLGSALLLFVALLPLGRHSDGSPVDPFSSGAAVALGAAYAAIVALKSTLVIPAAIHFVMLLIAALVAVRPKRAAAWAITVAATGLACILPWLLNQLYRLPPGLIRTLTMRNDGATEEAIATTRATLDLLSTEPLFYGFGATYAHYAALAALVCICAVIVVFRDRCLDKPGNAPFAWAIVTCTSLPVFFALHMATVGRYGFGYETALRYAVPVFIALVPASLICAAAARPDDPSPMPLRTSLRSADTLLPGALLIAIVASFAGPVRNRIDQIVNYGSDLSFHEYATERFLRRYIGSALAGDVADRVRDIQSAVPPGDTLLAFVNPAFQLDFARNPILEVQPSGLASPLQRFPFDGSLDDAAAFLAASGVEYVFWQYDGLTARTARSMRPIARSSYPADRRVANNTIRFVETLEQLKRRSQVIHDDGTFALFRLR